MVRDPVLDTDAIAGWAVDMGINSMMNTAWGWPLAEIIHFLGICLLIGSVGMFDLRMIGLVRGVSMAGLHRLVPFGVLGFLMSVVSGISFVATTPGQYIYNPAWQTKMVLIAIAGFNMVLFYLTMSRTVNRLAPDASPPLAARIFAGVSLFSWLGVIACGRVVTAFRPPFHWCFWCS